jgi:hypothetical protein
MVLNVWAFTRTTPGAFGHLVGLALPLWVLALTFLGEHQLGKCRPCALAAFVLAGFLLAVSLPHIASGYATLGLHAYEGWSLAVVTDLLQVVAKVAVIRIVRRGA